MSEETETPEKAGTEKKLGNWVGTAAIAGAAVIGSAALAAALLYTSRRKNDALAPSHPEEAPETD